MGNHIITFDTVNKIIMYDDKVINNVVSIDIKSSATECTEVTLKICGVDVKAKIAVEEELDVQ